MTPLTLTPTTIIISLLTVGTGYVANAVQTGSFLGVKTIPKPWLPYLALGGSFLTAGVQSIASASPVNAAAWFTALQAGLFALIGASAGVTVHQHITATATRKPPPPPPEHLTKSAISVLTEAIQGGDPRDIRSIQKILIAQDLPSLAAAADTWATVLEKLEKETAAAGTPAAGSLPPTELPQSAIDTLPPPLSKK